MIYKFDQWPSKVVSESNWWYQDSLFFSLSSDRHELSSIIYILIREREPLEIKWQKWGRPKSEGRPHCVSRWTGTVKVTYRSLGSTTPGRRSTKPHPGRPWRTGGCSCFWRSTMPFRRSTITWYKTMQIQSFEIVEALLNMICPV